MSCDFALPLRFKPIAVINKDQAGAKHIAPKCQSFWYVEGELVMTQKGPIEGHGTSPHSNPVMAEGSPWYVLIDSCGEEYSSRQTDKATCCHESTGRPWWWVN